MAQVFQLADVAGQLEPRQVLQRLVGEPLRLDAELLRASGKKMF